MHLYELSKGASIVFEVLVDEKRFEFKSVVEGKASSALLTKPIVIKGKVIGLSGDNVTLNVIYTVKGRYPLQWSGVKCSTVTYRNKVFYKLESESVGEVINRRDNFRLSVNIKCITKIVDSNAISVSTLRDVSEFGFSFVSDKGFIRDNDDAVIEVSFSDMNQDISFMGMVVRKEVSSNDKVLYGCVLASKSQKLNKYIIDKQRMQIADSIKTSCVYACKEKEV